MPENSDHDAGAFGPAHPLDRIPQVFTGRSVNLDNLVSRLDAGPVGRRALDGGNDGDQVVAHGHMDTDAVKLAMGVNLKLLQGIGRKQGRVGIQAPDHALNGRFDHFLGFDLIHVVSLDELDDVGKKLQAFVGLFAIGGQIPVKAVTQYQHS